MKNQQSNQQHQIVLDASKKDIQHFIEDTYQIEQYQKHRDMVERNLMARMLANGIDELGGKVRIEQEHYFENIEVEKLLSLFLDDNLAKCIVVKVDIPMTEKNLRDRHNYTEVAIKPMIDILKSKLSAHKDVLKIIKKTNNKEK